MTLCGLLIRKNYNLQVVLIENQAMLNYKYLTTYCVKSYNLKINNLGSVFKTSNSRIAQH